MWLDLSVGEYFPQREKLNVLTSLSDIYALLLCDNCQAPAPFIYAMADNVFCNQEMKSHSLDYRKVCVEQKTTKQKY